MPTPVMEDFSLTCPIPIQQYPRILLAHGGGGRLMQQLIQELFRSAFGSSTAPLHDATALTLPTSQIAFTTDSFVVNPLIFPGGDIGSLAIHGTVNDLAMSGARPLYLSAGFILEEGLPMTTLWQIVRSMQQAAQAAHVQIVTGDTKVVDRGKGDGIFINTAGIGIREHPDPIGPEHIQVGDVILVNGDLGRHGIAVMATREGLEFETTIESDSAPLADLVLTLLDAGIQIHCMRDLTRGGLSSALNEIAVDAGMRLIVYENQIPVREDVGGLCEILGLDPFYVANEGRFVAFVPADQADQALELMQSHPLGEGSQIMGEVKERGSGLVLLQTSLGSQRVLDLLSGEQLPRIC